jgi:hypothetical protein
MATLEELSGERWPEPESDATPLVRKCAKYIKTDLSTLSNEGVRILVGQRIYLKHLLPVALARLAPDPWLECDFYPGDLLKSVLECANEADALEFLTQIEDLAVTALRTNVPEFTPDDLMSGLLKILKREN